VNGLPGIILDLLKMGVIHYLIMSRTISENIGEVGSGLALGWLWVGSGLTLG
jgi:hypothetical protein